MLALRHLTALVPIALASALLGGCGGDGPSPLAATPLVGGKADGTEPDLALCAEGLVLPAIWVKDYLKDHSHAPTPRYGLPLGPVNERTPFSFEHAATGAYDPATGLTQQGWLFSAAAGERFRGSATTCGTDAGPDVYGPITGCLAPAPPAAYWDRDLRDSTWTAPADGLYFLTPRHDLICDRNGTLSTGVTSKNTCSFGETMRWQRLLADGTPAGHTLVEAATWPYHVADLSIVELDDGTRAILAVGTYRHYLSDPNPDDSYRPFEWRAGLMVIRQGALETPEVFEAGPLPSEDRLVHADLTGDGRRDVLWGANLFVQQPDGSYAHQWSGYRTYNKTYGLADVDGDGALDALSARLTVTRNTVGQNVGQLLIQPHFNSGGAFKAGAYRRATVTLANDTPQVFHTRGGLLDVTGDGRPEIVISIRPGYHGLAAAESFAFAVPEVDAADAEPSSSQGDLPLTPVPVSQDQALAIEALERSRTRHFDLDGDGLLDALYGSASSVELSYGLPDGTFARWWEIPTTGFVGISNPELIEAADFDGDGCPDVLLGGSGLALLRGLRCGDGTL